MLPSASLSSLSCYYLLHCTSSPQLCPPYLSTPSSPCSHPHLAELICNEISFTFLSAVRIVNTFTPDLPMLYRHMVLRTQWPLMLMWNFLLDLHVLPGLFFYIIQDTIDIFIITSSPLKPITHRFPLVRDQLKGVETGTCSSDVSHSSVPFWPEQFLECVCGEVFLKFGTFFDACCACLPSWGADIQSTYISTSLSL